MHEDNLFIALCDLTRKYGVKNPHQFWEEIIESEGPKTFEEFVLTTRIWHGVEVVSFVDGESQLIGEDEIFYLAKVAGALSGLRSAKILRKNPQLIPEEAKRFRLIFPDINSMTLLYWSPSGEDWHYAYHRNELYEWPHRFGVNDRFVRPK